LIAPFAFLDALLASAAVVIEGDETPHRPRQVGDDKADARIKLTRMPDPWPPLGGALFY
jgi:hypothetical protein